MQRLEGGCQVPIACVSKVDKETLTVEGLVAATSGDPIIRRSLSGPLDQARKLGLELADAILEMGGREILEEVYSR